MPAKSQKQRAAVAIAEHAPGKLFKRNRAMLSMSKTQMYDYASMPSKSLPKRAKASTDRRRKNDEVNES